jgi:hypothetical protein
VDTSIDGGLEGLPDLRGAAAKRSPTVKVLAGYSGHTDCNVATLAFAAGVDMDRLLTGTPFQPQFGQSPFAFARGLQFEQSLRENGYAKALDLLRTEMHFAVRDARVRSLRDGFPRNRQGMLLRANETRDLVRQILAGERHAPNLIDGAVLTAQVAGATAYFEADALAARFDSPIHAGEIKSFPIVDGRADGTSAGAALDQAAVYILLTQRLVDDLGGDPDAAVSTLAMLIAPRNVGLTPTLVTQDVRARMRRISDLLGRPVPVRELGRGLSAGVFGSIADQTVETARRMERMDRLVEQVGTKYTSTCLSTCGAARYCRARRVASGSPELGGPQLVRLLPNIPTLNRAADLVDGAPPSAIETPAAKQLRRAGRLLRATPTDTRG